MTQDHEQSRRFDRPGRRLRAFAIAASVSLGFAGAVSPKNNESTAALYIAERTQSLAFVTPFPPLNMNRGRLSPSKMMRVFCIGSRPSPYSGGSR